MSNDSEFWAGFALGHNVVLNFLFRCHSTGGTQWSTPGLRLMLTSGLTPVHFTGWQQEWLVHRNPAWLLKSCGFIVYRHINVTFQLSFTVFKHLALSLGLYRLHRAQIPRHALHTCIPLTVSLLYTLCFTHTAIHKQTCSTSTAVHFTCLFAFYISDFGVVPLLPSGKFLF